MTDVLLTHSYHLPYDSKQVRKMQPYPPLGTLYAAALLRQQGLSVALFDTMLTDPAEFAKALRQYRPSIVAVYEDDFNFLSKMCLTRMREIAFDMAAQTKAYGAHVVVHGSDASDHAREFLEAGFEYVLVGEAEHTLLELSRAMLRDGDPSQVEGVAYLEATSGQVRRSLPRRPLRYPHPLPPPARDLVNHDVYREAWMRAHGRFSLNAISSRGCPFQCNWCAKPIFGDRYLVQDAVDVAEEMQTLRDVYGADHVWFADDIFGLNRHWVGTLADEVDKRRAAIPFKVQARADLLERNTAFALARAGCEEVWMGVESGSQSVLDAMDKGLRLEDVYNARENLRAAGIRACYFLQLGYPGEDWPELAKTIALVRNTRPDDIGVSVSYPLPNTRFYDRVRADLGAKRNWRDSDDLSVIFKGAYTDEFYRLVRDALHLEVKGWSSDAEATFRARALWSEIEGLEPVSRNADATPLLEQRAPAQNRLIALNQLTMGAGD